MGLVSTLASRLWILAPCKCISGCVPLEGHRLLPPSRTTFGPGGLLFHALCPLAPSLHTPLLCTWLPRARLLLWEL